jgi:hypothetical protein
VTAVVPSVLLSFKREHVDRLLRDYPGASGVHLVFGAGCSANRALKVCAEARANVDLILTKYKAPLDAGWRPAAAGAYFSAVLGSTLGQQYFEQHLRREYSDENLEVRTRSGHCAGDRLPRLCECLADRRSSGRR